jgi:CRP-like cAMP-binding protein
MHEHLIKFITEHSTSPLTEEDLNIIRRAFIPKRFHRRQFFLQEGEVCRHLGFITKGAMKQYSVDTKGAEHIVYLTIENWWVADRGSFVEESPSLYFIEAFEDTELLMVSKEDAEKYVYDITAFKEFRNRMDNKHSIALMNRINDNITLSAEDRFNKLQQSYPDFLQRFPQHIIASYLGITKETLSRVRNQIGKK